MSRRYLLALMVREDSVALRRFCVLSLVIVLATVAYEAFR